MFLLHINDLPSVITSQIRLFADDCLIYHPICSSAHCEALQRDLDSLERWSSAWGMKFIVQYKKCQIMFIASGKSHPTYLYNLCGHVLSSGVPVNSYPNQVVPCQLVLKPTLTLTNSYLLPTRTQTISYPIPTRTQTNCIELVILLIFVKFCMTTRLRNAMIYPRRLLNIFSRFLLTEGSTLPYFIHCANGF